MNETLRCSQQANMSGHVDAHQDRILGGYLVPKNTPVFTAFAVAHFNEKVFPDPER